MYLKFVVIVERFLILCYLLLKMLEGIVEGDKLESGSLIQFVIDFQSKKEPNDFCFKIEMDGFKYGFVKTKFTYKYDYCLKKVEIDHRYIGEILYANAKKYTIHVIATEDLGDTKEEKLKDKFIKKYKNYSVQEENGEWNYKGYIYSCHLIEIKKDDK